MSVLKLAIGLPAYGGKIIAEQARMWAELGNTCGASNERFRLTMFGHVDVNPIDRARNLLVAQAMLHNSDWLFMVDADTYVEAFGDEDAGMQILRMISDADRLGCMLVSAAVVLRGKADDGTHKLAVYDRNRDGKYKPQPIDWIHTQNRRLIPVDAVGAACFAINVRKLAEIEPALLYQFTDTLSEDLGMCRALLDPQVGAVRDADGRVIREREISPNFVMVDPRVLTGHVGKPEILSVKAG